MMDYVYGAKIIQQTFSTQVEDCQVCESQPITPTELESGMDAPCFVDSSDDEAKDWPCATATWAGFVGTS
jgi:hypothetical protein